MQNKPTIGSLLVKYGFISEAELDEALDKQKKTGRRLGELLVESEKITKQDIEWLLSKQLDIPFIIPDEAGLDMDLISRFPRELLINNRILPMHETDDKIAIATDDPFNNEAFDLVSQYTGGKEVALSAGDGEKIEEILNRIYRREAVPEFLELIEKTVDSIRDTFFYRMDFMFEEYSLEVSVFGSGVLRHMRRIESAHNPEDVLKALNMLGMKYLYEEFRSSGRNLLFVYPLEGVLDVPGYPLVLGMFGLGEPEGISFSDVNASDVPDIFQSSTPVPGYDYLMLKSGGTVPGRMIFTPDNVPGGYELYHVKTLVPKACPACSTKGCAECRELGYLSDPMSGTYSYDEIMKAAKGDLNA